MHSKHDEILNSFHVRNEETYFVYVFGVEDKWIGENMYEWHGEGMTVFFSVRTLEYQMKQVHGSSKPSKKKYFSQEAVML